MKNRKTIHSLLIACLILAITLIPCAGAYAASTPATPNAISASEKAGAGVPSELPVSTGISIGTINKYSMAYSSSHYDAELGGIVLTFKLSDAGKLAALTSYCAPSYRLAEELTVLKEALKKSNTDDVARPLMNVQEMLNELLVNAGGGPDYRHVKQAEAIGAAERVILTEEFKQFVEATKPLAKCEKTDVRSLMLTFTDEELAKILADVREAAYGEWGLRLTWLDEMEFSLVLPVEATVDSATVTPTK